MASEDTDELQARYRKAWSRMDRGDRRRVMRAVNRMQALDDPAEAALAILYAQRQRRLWVRWWWVLPAVNGLVAAPRGWASVGINVAIGVVLVAVIASLFTWRAGRATQVNREVLEQTTRRRRSGSPQKRAAAKPRGPRPRGGKRRR